MNMSEHMAQINALAPLNKMTHVAVSNGDWSNPATWNTGTVPGAEAKVHIPSGITVKYDMDASTPLSTVRVGGSLEWATNEDTTMRVETIVTEMGSHFQVGIRGDEIDADVTARIVFRDTAINTAEDPQKLSHGLVAHGEVDIVGAEKESFVEIAGGTVSKGATSVTLSGDLTNWNVGDELLIVGTGNGSRDETREIVSINGNTVTFDKALSHDHRPPAGMDVATYVGNLSRNVVFSSENPDGTRGHVMLMNDMAKPGEAANCVMFAEFDEMGRTDESIATGTASNPIGRYPLHLHQIGTEPDAANNMIKGVAVSGAPGWGMVQHSSNAMIVDSIIYDTVGAGMVSEWGDETGMWLDNLVSSVAGTGRDEFQVGVEGAAYENQSRVIVQQGNIAANANVAWNYFGREDFPEDAGNPSAPKDGAHRKMFERGQVPFDPSPFDVALDHEEPPIIDFDNNTAIATGTGLRVFHRQTSDDSDTMSVFKNFTIWGGNNAVALDNYASNYQFMDSVWQGSETGFSIMRKTSSVVFKDVEMRDFDTGYRSWGVNHEVVLIDTEFRNVDQTFDLNDLLKNVSDSGTRNELIRYYRENHGIDYTNPMPQIVDSSKLTPVDRITFKADAGSDLTIGRGDNTLNITGTITDSVGVRNFNEYVIAKPPNGKGTSKDFEGIDIYLGAKSDGRLKEFTLEMFLDTHGAFKKADGTWVSPVVNWITDRLTGDFHPVIIEIKIVGMTDGELAPYALAAYPDPEINEGSVSVAAPPKPVEPTTPSPEPTPPSPEPELPTGAETIGGTSGSDTLNGTSGNDMIFGAGSGDALNGFDGNDTLRGDGGNDTLSGGNGNDSLLGGDGNDVLSGSTGDDTLIGNRGFDTMWGGNGNDTLLGGTGNDTLIGGGGADSLLGQAGNDSLEGGTENDTLKGGAGNDTLLGQAGDDSLDGGLGDDLLNGGGENDSLVGGGGNDTLIGADGNDALLGEAGNDVISGGSGNDVIVGGAGLDILSGGSGADVFTFTTASLDGYRDTITDFSLAEGDTLDLSSIASAHGLSGTALSDAIRLQDVDAGVIVGIELGSQVYQLARLDGLRASDFGSAQPSIPQVPTPPSGTNLVLGTDERDALTGTSGADILDGLQHRDSLTGGAGADIFRFTAVSLDGHRDAITDFSLAEGDRIDLSGIAATYGLNATEMSQLVEYKNINPGLRIGIDIDGEFEALAVLEGVKADDFDPVAAFIYTSESAVSDDGIFSDLGGTAYGLDIQSGSDLLDSDYGISDVPFA